MNEFPARVCDIPVVFFETIGSTNAEALRLAQAGDTGPSIIVAERQEAGRGRRGRLWVSEPGNLYVTVLLPDPSPPATSPQICFVAALALHDAVLDLCSGLAPTRLQLKWPNDLLLDGTKVSGILVEGTAISDSGIATAVGFGVNCKHHPEGAQFPADDFANAGFDLLPQKLLDRLIARFMSRIDEWSRGEGFSAIRKAWLLRAVGVGKPIEVRLLDRNLSGTFETIDEQGALVLRMDTGEREIISAGDVFPIVGRTG